MVPKEHVCVHGKAGGIEAATCITRLKTTGLSAEKPEAMMDAYIHLCQKSRDVFALHYKETIDPDKNRWELCSRITFVQIL